MRSIWQPARKEPPDGSRDSTITGGGGHQSSRGFSGPAPAYQLVSTTEATHLGSVRNVIERRSGKAKTGEEAECRVLHEHSEPVFNAASRAKPADTFRTETNSFLSPTPLATRPRCPWWTSGCAAFRWYARQPISHR